MPNAVLEALSCGVPVVATDVGGMRDALPRGDDPESGGKIVSRDDFASFVSATRVYVKDRNLRQRAGRKARMIAVQKMSATRMIDEYEALYLDIAKS
jgi:glycosyltransferase involved in cell wall biosynthesis